MNTNKNKTVMETEESYQMRIGKKSEIFDKNRAPRLTLGQTHKQFSFTSSLATLSLSGWRAFKGGPSH